MKETIRFRKNKFEITDTTIAIYPNLRVKTASYVLILLVIAFFAIDVESLMSSTVALVSGAIVILLFLFLGFFFSRRRIVFDTSTKNVYSTIGSSFKKNLIRFDEILDINKSTDQISGLCYRIQPKKDIVGTGIKITGPYANKITPSEMQFIEHILPKIKAMVFNESTVAEMPDTNVQNDISLKHFKTSDGSVFEYKPLKKTVYFIIIAVLLTGLLYASFTFILQDVQNNTLNIKGMVGILFFIIAAVWGIYNATQNIVINKAKNTLVQSNFFGLIERSHNLSNFITFAFTKQYVNGIYTGTELKLNFLNNASIKIDQKYDTVKIQELMEELTLLLSDYKYNIERK